jgi:hypothetical protein
MLGWGRCRRRAAATGEARPGLIGSRSPPGVLLAKQHPDAGKQKPQRKQKYLSPDAEIIAEARTKPRIDGVPD